MGKARRAALKSRDRRPYDHAEVSTGAPDTAPALPSTDMARPKKNPASISPAKQRPAPAPKVKKPENVVRHLAFVFLAAALAGVATYVSRRLGHGGAPRRHYALSSVPESYAVCTEPGLVYTVDEHRPNADCLLVNKDRIAATGSLGALSCDFPLAASRRARALRPQVHMGLDQV